jgi:hypothetical protein
VLKQHQENEMGALKQRIELTLGEKSRQREAEEEEILQKYHNIVRELEYQHKQELIKEDKASKLKNAHKKTKISLLSNSKLSKAQN